MMRLNEAFVSSTRRPSDRVEQVRHNNFADGALLGVLSGPSTGVNMRSSQRRKISLLVFLYSFQGNDYLKLSCNAYDAKTLDNESTTNR